MHVYINADPADSGHHHHEAPAVRCAFHAMPCWKVPLLAPSIASLFDTKPPVRGAKPAEEWQKRVGTIYFRNLEAVTQAGEYADKSEFTLVCVPSKVFLNYVSCLLQLVVRLLPRHHVDSNAIFVETCMRLLLACMEHMCASPLLKSHFRKTHMEKVALPGGQMVPVVNGDIRELPYPIQMCMFFYKKLLVNCVSGKEEQMKQMKVQQWQKRNMSIHVLHLPN